MKSFIRLFLISVLIILSFSNALLSQPLPGGGSGGGPPGGNPLGAPIGDPVFPLLLIGVVYGLVRLYQIYRQQKIVKSEG